MARITQVAVKASDLPRKVRAECSGVGTAVVKQGSPQKGVASFMKTS